MKIHFKCPNCDQTTFYVRTSERLTRLTTKSIIHCRSCHAEMTVVGEIIKVRLPHYQERPEVLKATKPFNQIDPNQLSLSIPESTE